MEKQKIIYGNKLIALELGLVEPTLEFKLKWLITFCRLPKVGHYTTNV